jgi:hypothetical protein
MLIDLNKREGDKERTEFISEDKSPIQKIESGSPFAKKKYQTK